MAELIGLRTYTRKAFDDGVPNQVRSQFHAGHIHYKDDAGDFQDVDYLLSDEGTYWELTKASYRLRIAKDFGAPALIQFTNRYEGANHTITYEPHSIWWLNADQPNQRQQFRDAQSVTGVYDPLENVITWNNAFGPGVDFEVSIQRSGIKKWIVAKAAPPPGPYTNNWLVPVFRWDATGLKIRPTDGEDWDENSYLEADDFVIEEVGNRNLKSYIRRAFAVDADNRSRQLKVIFEKRGGALWQGKIIPENLLQQASYPVRADTTTDFYAGAGDGHLIVWNQGDWDACHDATTADVVGYTNTNTYVQAEMWTSTDAQISRVFIPIDTSGIPDSDNIDSATLFVYYYGSKNNEDNDGDDWVTVVQTFQASTSSLSSADYNQCGDAVDNPTEGIDSGNRIDLGTFTTSQYYSFSLNSTGLGWISKTGFTKLGLREGHDVIDSQVLDGTNNRLRWRTSEQSGTANDPYLEVVHSAGGVTVSRNTDSNPLGIHTGMGWRVNTP